MAPSNKDVQGTAGGTEQIAGTTRANQLAYRFLTLWRKKRADGLQPVEEAAYGDALDGLVRCCFRAIGRYYSAPVDVGDSRLRATRDFVEDQLLKLLAPYLDLPEQDLQAKAMAGGFKHLPREIQFDLMDRIRKKYSSIRAHKRWFLRIRINRERRTRKRRQ